MRSILVLNAKGGSGKTTLATNLAGYYAAEGARVALADLDPQGSSMDWLAQRPDTAPKIRGVEAFSRGLRVPRSVEVVIIDAPSRTHEDQLAGLLRRAQTVVVPVVPSPVDMRAAERFFGELAAVRPQVKNDVKIATIASRVREGGRVTEQLEDFLYDLRLPSGRRFPFLTLLRQSANYLKAAERGLSIFEFAPMATAVDREYWQPLLRWLASSRSLPEQG
ncbi:MAG: nucleotide-binding protein [Gammaproteobacteria bacterium]